MNGQGWIKVHREIFNSDIWHDVVTFRLFMYLIGMASHQDGLKHKGMTLNKGQFVRSYRKLADDLSYKEGRGYKKHSISTIKRSIQKLIDAERVNVKETELGTLFTIVNYAKYQHSNDQQEETKNGLSEEPGTKAERRRNEDGTRTRIKELKNIEEEEERAREENPFVLFEENICRLSPLNIDGLNQWCDDLGDELVIAAIKLAAKYNARSFAYVEDIFIEWYKNGIKTVEDARSYVREKNSRNNTIPFRRKQETNDVQAILDKFREV